ncbi:MAG TPA: Ig-like domain-containing protein [Gemmatimonadaceae bacterium]|nr:Ig-like domain-containing protein [Gemmatimonadaceae bacterium]
MPQINTAPPPLVHPAGAWHHIVRSASLRGVAAGALLLALAACLNDALTPDARNAVHLRVNAQLVGLSSGQEEAVGISVFYRHNDGSVVALRSDPARVGVTPGASTEQPVVVEIGQCLADPQRIGAGSGGCFLGVQLSLLDGTGQPVTSDTVELDTPASPGQTVVAPTVTISVGGAGISFLEVDPTDARMMVRDTLRLTPTVFDANGNQITDLTKHTVAWASSNQQVATISSAGLLTAVAAGTTSVSLQVDSASDTTQVTVFAPFDSVSVAAVGGLHICGLRGNPARMYCWGYNYDGAVGNGSLYTDSTGSIDSLFVDFPTAVVGSNTFSLASAGYIHSCALTPAGAAYCWGDNSSSQLGDGTTTSRAAPTPVSTSLVFTQLSAGLDHTCALTSSQAAYCWGDNVWGEIGDSTETERAVPTAVRTSVLFTQVSAGWESTCGVSTTGLIYCWGSLPGDTVSGLTESDTPLLMTEGGGFTQVGVGDFFACGLQNTGTVYCWGDNTYGELGDGTTTTRSFPGPVSGSLSFTQLAVGDTHACALTTDGTAYCWGDNSSGQLGDNNAESQSTTPVQVSGSVHFRSLAAGLDAMCGISSAAGAGLYCWGSTFGGFDDLDDHSTPTAVVLP